MVARVYMAPSVYVVNVHSLTLYICSFPGETAMNHDYYTLQPTYINHPAQDSSYAVLNGPVYATNLASEEYADVPDLVATATTSSNLDESQAYETPIPLGDHYECVTGHSLNSPVCTNNGECM